MSKGLDLMVYCAGDAVFHDIAMEAQPEIFPSDQDLSALVAKLT